MAVSVNIKIDSTSVEKLFTRFPILVRGAVSKAMAAEKKPMQAAVRSHVASRMKVMRKGFLNNFRVSVGGKTDPLPYMRIYSRGGWAGVHEHGVTIGKKMLIPINGRIGRKQFKAMVEELMRGGNAYFVKSRGKVILMAENIKEHDKPLAGVKKRHRKEAGIKRLKRGADIPIAILVNRVTVPKRLDVEGVVRGHIPLICKSIEKNLAGVMK